MIKIDNSKVQVVSFSGGRTSAYMVWLIESMRKSGEWTAPVEYIFMDTGAEHPKTYEFIKKCVEHFCIDLTCLQAEISMECGIGPKPIVVDLNMCFFNVSSGPFAMLLKKTGLPDISIPFCTRDLKSVIYDKYCRWKYGKNEFVSWIGIRADEKSRLKIGDRPDLRYLAEISSFYKEDVLDFWSEMQFDLEIDEHLGNCVFCIKKSINKLALAARDEPELLSEWLSAIDSASDRLNQPIEKITDGLFQEKYTHHIKKGVMYRGRNSMESIIAKFTLHSRDEIYDSIRSMKRKESGGCTESCEAFASEQIDWIG